MLAARPPHQWSWVSMYYVMIVVGGGLTIPQCCTDVFLLDIAIPKESACLFVSSNRLPRSPLFVLFKLLHVSRFLLL